MLQATKLPTSGVKTPQFPQLFGAAIGEASKKTKRTGVSLPF